MLRGRVLVLFAAAVVACGPAGDEARGAADGGAGEESAAATPSETVVLIVPSMSCPLCSRSIEAGLREAGVHDVRIDLETKRVTAVFDPSRTTAAEVEAVVEGQGFPVTESRRVEGSTVEVEP